MEKRYYENVKVKQLKYDQQVQGSLQMKRVKNIVSNYNPKFIGTIVVSKRDNGEYYVMDGFHRSTALKILNVEEILCEIHEGLTLEDEAQYYLAYNKHRKNPKAIDDFKVSVTAGVPEVVAVEGALRELGIEISESGCRSPRALLEIYRNYGIGITKKSTELYVGAWGYKELVGKYLKVLAKFIKDNEEKVDFSILEKSMKKYKFNHINESINRMLIAKEVSTAVKAFETLLYLLYNNGLPRNRRIDFIPLKLRA